MSYTLLRSMKVQKSDGTIELRKPGDKCPEAKDYPNLKSWIERGYLKADGDEDPLGYDRKKRKPNRKATAEDIARGSHSPAPKPGDPLPGHEPESEPEQEYSKDSDEEEYLDYSSMKASELRKACEDSGLDHRGKTKSEMSEMLESMGH